MKKSVYLGVVWLGLSCVVAQATPVLDAEFSPASPNTYWMFNDLDRAQTFTVGEAGLLSRFEVLINTLDATGKTRTFEVHPTVAGVPVLGSAPLASATITYGTAAGMHFYGADISSFGILVSPGDVLAIVDPGSGLNDGWWAGRVNSDLYPDGQLYTAYYTDAMLTIPSTDYRSEANYDLGFRTYVDAGAAVVPAPGALALAGVGALCTMIRRRR